MVKEILKVVPKLDRQALATMERTLNGRFKSITKKFGGGLKALFKGGLVGVALGFVTKILSPLKETREAIDRSLNSASDISTAAQKFNTTTGKLFKLVQFGEAADIDQQKFLQIMSKFQNKLALAAVDPQGEAASILGEFTGEKDVAENFFKFIQSLQSADQSKSLVAQQKLFGEEESIVLAELLQKDFSKLIKRIGFDNVGSEKLSRDLGKLGALQDKSAELKASLNLTDVQEKAATITERMVNQMHEADKKRKKLENMNIRNFENLQNLSNTMDQIMILIQKGVAEIGGFIPKVTSFVNDLLIKVDKMIESIKNLNPWRTK